VKAKVSSKKPRLSVLMQVAFEVAPYDCEVLVMARDIDEAFHKLSRAFPGKGVHHMSAKRVWIVR